jgi:hypothetical protein
LDFYVKTAFSGAVFLIALRIWVQIEKNAVAAYFSRKLVKRGIIVESVEIHIWVKK